MTTKPEKHIFDFVTKQKSLGEKSEVFLNRCYMYPGYKYPDPKKNESYQQKGIFMEGFEQDPLDKTHLVLKKQYVLIAGEDL